MIFGATFESYLELSPQVLVVLVAHQVAKQRLGIRPNIESFGRRRSGAITGCDIANRVAAGLARSNPGFCQEAQEVRSFFQLDVVDLRVFPRGEMQKATAKSISRIGQPDQLIRSQESARNLDALHLHSLL